MKKLLGFTSVLVLLAACETAPVNDADMAGRGAGYGQDGGAGAAETLQGDLAQTAGDRVFFAFDSSALSSEAQSTLERQASWLKSHPNVDVVVEGHCDERGTREYNLGLGERRANSAKKYLVSLGVPESRITTISYGKERPAVLGSTESAWAQNRRAVTVVAY